MPGTRGHENVGKGFLVGEAPSNSPYFRLSSMLLAGSDTHICIQPAGFGAHPGRADRLIKPGDLIQLDYLIAGPMAINGTQVKRATDTEGLRVHREHAARAGEPGRTERLPEIIDPARIARSG